MRTFTDRPAVREKTPLLIGLVGPSGGGKTFSALRLATGIQRVSGGEVFFIDTEADRALHYADKFRFRHLPFAAPFAPLDYLAAVQHCIDRKAGVIVVDSTSHEHEGQGGVLEMHEAELDRLAGNDFAKRQRLTMLAWAKPKAQRRALINALLQFRCNFIFCFRAKPKLKMVKGQDPEPLGYMPIAGEEFVYEQTLKCLLLPGANGVPAWQSEFSGERAMMKLPDQFKSIFANPVQLSEDIGEKLARWAAGAPASTSPAESNNVAAMIANYDRCPDRETFEALEKTRAKLWTSLKAGEKVRAKEASDAAGSRLAEQPAENLGAESDDDYRPPEPGEMFAGQTGQPAH